VLQRINGNAFPNVCHHRQRFCHVKCFSPFTAAASGV
jgi:hypothetical protein